MPRSEYFWKEPSREERSPSTRRTASTDGSIVAGRWFSSAISNDDSDYERIDTMIVQGGRWQTSPSRESLLSKVVKIGSSSASHRSCEALRDGIPTATHPFSTDCNASQVEVSPTAVERLAETAASQRTSFDVSLLSTKASSPVASSSISAW